MLEKWMGYVERENEKIERKICQADECAGYSVNAR